MPKQHAKVIVNPAAGANSTRHKWPSIQNLIKKAGLAFEFQFTEGKGHGIELAKEAASDGYRYLIAVGGDGTVHEVMNGIMQTNNADRTDLGIISTGTGKDLSRSIGLSRDYTHAVDYLSNAKRLTVDVGVVEYYQNNQKKQRYFVNSAGIGFDAATVEATERMPKYFGGTIPYLIGLCRSFLGYHNKSVTFTIGDKTEKARVLSIVAANGRFFGGGMQVAPEAKLDDGLLDFMIIGNFGKLELLKALPRVYKGTHLTHQKVRLEKGTTLSIQSEQKFLLHADGELLGEGPVSFSLIPRALNLVV